jgi:CRISPR-associated endonuclease/helicase Cas3
MGIKNRLLWGNYAEVLGDSKVFYAHCNELLEEHGKHSLTHLKNLETYFGDIPLLSCLGERRMILNILEELTYFHDLGKANPKFQENLVKSCGGKRIELPAHSEEGFSKIANHLFEKWKEDKENKILTLAFLFSTIVDRHHSKLKNLSEYEKLGQCYEKAKHVVENQVSLYLAYRLFYSGLKTSDILASSFGGCVEDISKTTIDSNKIKEYKANLERYLKSLKGANESITQCRESFRRKALERTREIIQKMPEKRILFLYLPTGGGKTLTSLSMALELTEKKNLKRIFYVFPYINIIEQNSRVLQEIFGRDLEAIHTYSDCVEVEIEDKDEEKGDYKHLLNFETLNFPAVVMSSVRFFDILFSNKKSSVLKTWALANSVVIIDEVQYFPNKYWEVIITILAELGKLFNIYFILMSATLPQLDIFLEKDKDLVTYIIQKKDIKEESKEFASRVKIETLEIGDESLETVIRRKVEELIQNTQKVLVVVNTIGACREVYDELHDKFADVDIYLLNSQILYPRRLEILEALSQNGRKKLLVSTQSIEAGVDLDFDVGIREKAPPESIIQVMGRVNRERRYQNSVLYVTDKSSSLEDVYLYYCKLGVYVAPPELNDADAVDRYLKEIAERLRIWVESPKMLDDVEKLKFEDVGQREIIEKWNMIDIFFDGEIKIKDKYLVRKSQINAGERVKEILDNLGWEGVYDPQPGYCILYTRKFGECYNKYIKELSEQSYEKKLAELPAIRKLGYIWRMFGFSSRLSTIRKLDSALEKDIYGRNWIKSPYYSFEEGLILPDAREGDTALFIW